MKKHKLVNSYVFSYPDLMKTEIDAKAIAQAVKRQEMTRATFSVPKEIHDAFRKECERLGIDMSPAVVELMKRFLGRKD